MHAMDADQLTDINKINLQVHPDLAATLYSFEYR